MSQIVGHEPDFIDLSEVFNESLEDVEGHEEFEAKKKCLKGWFDDKHDYLGHHQRMIKATNRIKARQEFIDGDSTDS